MFLCTSPLIHLINIKKSIKLNLKFLIARLIVCQLSQVNFHPKI